MTFDATRLEFHEFGDAALLVEVHGQNDELRWRGAQSLGRTLRTLSLAGVTDTLATYQHVFIAFDPLRTCPARIRAALESPGAQHPGWPASRRLQIPVVYGNAFGPDLEAVAAELLISPQALIGLHTSEPWTVRFIASPLAAPFLEGPRTSAPVARMAVPRTRVPVGSVALSGHQCTIYAGPSPGGWRIIGRTPLQLFDATRDPFVAYRPADEMQFVAVEAADWEQWRDPPAGTVRPSAGRA